MKKNKDEKNKDEKNRINNKTKKKTNKKTITNNKNNTFNKDDFNSGDGMLTSVWGPSLWHVLHTISFNYPVKPTKVDKKNYYNFIMTLQNVLPCRYCRENLKNNLKCKDCMLTKDKLKNRDTFSRWMYELHEKVNTMLCKKSNLTFEQVRNRYENFRSRCSSKNNEVPINITNTSDINKPNKRGKIVKKVKEKGCTKPLYGVKSKCIIKIVPKEEKTETFQMDKRCVWKREK